MLEGETKIALLRRELCALSLTNPTSENQRQGPCGQIYSM